METGTFLWVSCITSRKIVFCCSLNESLPWKRLREKKQSLEGKFKETVVELRDVLNFFPRHVRSGAGELTLVHKLTLSNSLLLEMCLFFILP